MPRNGIGEPGNIITIEGPPRWNGRPPLLRRRDLRGPLGDVLCSADEMASASAAVRALAKTSDQAPEPVRLRYRSQVQAILAQWNDLAQQQRGIMARAVPWGFYCNFKGLAQRARDVTDRIAAESGQAGSPDDPNLRPGLLASLATIAKWTFGLALVGGLAYGGWRVYRGVSGATPLRTRFRSVSTQAQARLRSARQALARRIAGQQAMAGYLPARRRRR